MNQYYDRRVPTGIVSDSIDQPHPAMPIMIPQMITTATTTLVKTGQGVVRGIIVNGGTTGTITIFDNTAASGKQIIALDTTNTIGFIPIDSEFLIGLTVVTSAATKVTVLYR